MLRTAAPGEGEQPGDNALHGYRADRIRTWACPGVARLAIPRSKAAFSMGVSNHLNECYILGKRGVP